MFTIKLTDLKTIFDIFEYGFEHKLLNLFPALKYLFNMRDTDLLFMNLIKKITQQFIELLGFIEDRF